MTGIRILAPLVLVAVAACSVATPARVATLRAAETPATIAFDPPGPDEAQPTGLGLVFRDALGAALAQHSVTTDVQSRFRLAIGFAQRPADAGVGRIDGSAVDWTSEPRRHRWFDACHAQRVDAVIALRDSTSGAVVGRWRGGFDQCEPGEARVRELASRFAEAIVNRQPQAR